jgi:hypothetical protein
MEAKIRRLIANYRRDCRTLRFPDLSAVTCLLFETLSGISLMEAKIRRRIADYRRDCGTTDKYFDRLGPNPTDAQMDAAPWDYIEAEDRLREAVFRLHNRSMTGCVDPSPLGVVCDGTYYFFLCDRHEGLGALKCTSEPQAVSCPREWRLYITDTIRTI